MRVLMLNYEYPPLGGGAGNATFYLMREFGKRDDIAVDLVTSSATGKFEEEHPSDGITIYKLPLRKKSVHFWTMREIISYSVRANSFIRRIGTRQYDLCHAFFGLPCGGIAWINRKQLPYIVSLRGSDVPGFNERFVFEYKLLAPIIRQIWKNAAAVVANSTGLRTLAMKTDSHIPIQIINNGIDTKEFAVRRDRADDRVIVLSVARLIRRKGLIDLINAIPEVLNGCPDLLVRIIGVGNLEDELHELVRKLGVAEYVEFLGYIPHAQLAEYYTTSDLFVLPSWSEGMSNTILEAMAAGLPIITTDTGGTHELVAENGLVVQPGRPDLIAGAILQYISDPSLRLDHGTRSRALAESMDWTRVADHYIRLYGELV